MFSELIHYDVQQTGATAYSNAYFGQGIIPIILDNVGCSGSEARLIDCYYSSHIDCSHSDDAGVRCITGQPKLCYKVCIFYKVFCCLSLERTK